MALNLRIIKIILVVFFVSFIFTGCAIFSSNTVIKNNKKSHYLYIIGIPIWGNEIEYIDENLDFYTALRDEINSKEKLADEIKRQLNSKQDEIKELQEKIDVNKGNIANNRKLETQVTSLKKNIVTLEENLHTARISVIKSKEEAKEVTKEKEKERKTILEILRVPFIHSGSENTKETENTKLE